MDADKIGLGTPKAFETGNGGRLPIQIRLGAGEGDPLALEGAEEAIQNILLIAVNSVRMEGNRSVAPVDAQTFTLSGSLVPHLISLHL